MIIVYDFVRSSLRLAKTAKLEWPSYYARYPDHEGSKSLYGEKVTRKFEDAFIPAFTH